MDFIAFLHPSDLGWEFLLLFLAFAFILLIVSPAFIILIWVKVYLTMKDKTENVNKKAE